MTSSDLHKRPINNPVYCVITTKSELNRILSYISNNLQKPKNQKWNLVLDLLYFKVCKMLSRSHYNGNSVSPEELARRVAEKPNTSFYNIVQYLISIIKVYIL